VTADLRPTIRITQHRNSHRPYVNSTVSLCFTGNTHGWKLHQGMNKFACACTFAHKKPHNEVSVEEARAALEEDSAFDGDFRAEGHTLQ